MVTLLKANCQIVKNTRQYKLKKHLKNGKILLWNKTRETIFCKKTNNNNETDYDWGIVVNERKHYLSLVSDRCK